MPSLEDIVDIVEAMETKGVFVAEDRCVVVRNRNVSCRKCENICPVNAFSIEGNTLLLDSKICISCGACTTVCPTEALISLRPLDDDLAYSIADVCLQNEGVAVFACARIASKGLADPSKFAEVPCLARIEESILIELAAQDVGTILLVDGMCASCKFRDCNKGIDASVASANTLLTAMGSSIRIERRLAFPDFMLSDDTSGLRGVSRRGFFTKARGTAKEAAEKTVMGALNVNRKKEMLNLRERLGVLPEGTLPQFEATRRMRILDSLERIGAPQKDEIETRLWGNISISLDACNACSRCAVFCPTGAIREFEMEDEAQDKLIRVLEFSLADCVQCRTCEDICLKHCLQVGEKTSLNELFDFEPRVIPLPEPFRPQDFSW